MFSAIPAEWVVLAAGGAFITGYLIINQVILRWMVNLGTLLYIWYYAIAIEEPWAAILTSVAMGTANCIGLAQIYYRNSKLVIPKEHKDIYPLFETLPPGDFRALMKFAKRYELPKKERVTVEGKPCEALYYVLNGELSAEKMGEKFKLPDNIFVGEVVYMMQQNASASTDISKGAEVLKWDIGELRAKGLKDDRFRLALDALISTDLARKVTTAVAPKGYDPKAEAG